MSDTKRVSDQDVLTWLKATADVGARLRIDSRQIEPGDIFVAIKGARVDGITFAQVAAAHGAKGILMQDGQSELPIGPLPRFGVDDLPARLGQIASLYYGEPSKRLMGIAVTGTNGKTSISHWISHLMTEMGFGCAAIGTIGCFLKGRRFESPALTTPDAVSQQGLLADLLAAGAQAFAVEASSIGLEQGRLNGTRIHTAVFTNLTRDHLDYHGTMLAYEEAKARLFDWPDLRCAVINLDDPAGERYAERCAARGVRVIGYSLEPERATSATLAARNIRACEGGTQFELVYKDDVYPIEVKAIGRYNVSNLLGAAGAALSFGLTPSAVFAALSQLVPPLGRLQMVRSDDAPLAVVDYAHTPDALEKAAMAVRDVVNARQGKLWVVFGAGGDRDPGKRPVMGAVAARCADRVVVTSDNPRTEDPIRIIDEIMVGIEDAACVSVEPDRAKAIETAICEADARDVVLIAGKGHEDYQEINGVKHDFSDMESARRAMNERRVRGG